MAWAWQPIGCCEHLPNFHPLRPSAAKGIYSPERGLSHMFVPVVDQDQHPLMPTTAAGAKRWIKSGKAAAFWKAGIFCVRLNVEPSAREIQPIAVGIDPGSKREGYSVISAAYTYLNIQAEARDGVKDAEEQSTQKLPPSTRARWQWKLRLARSLCQILPISVFVVEDIAATTKKGKRRWNTSFAPLEVGKHWFYEEMRKLAALQLMQGYETKALREQLGLKKAGKKLAEVWEAHAVDAWVLAYSRVGRRTPPDNRRLVCSAPLNWHHRQLHRLRPEKGGKRKPYGGTLSQGIKRGTLVKHPKWGKATVGRTMDGKLSLHNPRTHKRLTQTAQVADCQPIKLLRWRMWLVPLAPNPASPPPNKQDVLPPRHEMRGASARRVR
jgi:hypothetical protein